MKEEDKNEPSQGRAPESTEGMMEVDEAPAVSGEEVKKAADIRIDADSGAGAPPGTADTSAAAAAVEERPGSDSADNSPFDSAAGAASDLAGKTTSDSAAEATSSSSEKDESGASVNSASDAAQALRGRSE